MGTDERTVNFNKIKFQHIALYIYQINQKHLSMKNSDRV